MKTFFVVHEGGEDESFSCDAPIVADNAEEAYNMWRSYAAEEDWPLTVGEIARVFELKLSGPGVVAWDHITALEKLVE